MSFCHSVHDSNNLQFLCIVLCLWCTCLIVFPSKRQSQQQLSPQALICSSSSWVEPAEQQEGSLEKNICFTLTSRRRTSSAESHVPLWQPGWLSIILFCINLCAILTFCLLHLGSKPYRSPKIKQLHWILNLKSIWNNTLLMNSTQFNWFLSHLCLWNKHYCSLKKPHISVESFL